MPDVSKPPVFSVYWFTFEICDALVVPWAHGPVEKSKKPMKADEQLASVVCEGAPVPNTSRRTVPTAVEAISPSMVNFQKSALARRRPPNTSGAKITPKFWPVASSGVMPGRAWTVVLRPRSSEEM